MLATLIDKEFSKTEIIYAYLETYRFGNFIGIIELCKNENYKINSLSHYEYAQIAARLKYPTINKLNYIKYLKRVRTVEILMHNNVKYLTFAKTKNIRSNIYAKHESSIPLDVILCDYGTK